MGIKISEEVKTASAMLDAISEEIYYGQNFKCELVDLMKKDPKTYDKLAQWIWDVNHRRARK